MFRLFDYGVYVMVEVEMRIKGDPYLVRDVLCLYGRVLSSDVSGCVHTYRLNSCGERIEPCGAPECMMIFGDSLRL